MQDNLRDSILNSSKLFNISKANYISIIDLIKKLPSYSNSPILKLLELNFNMSINNFNLFPEFYNYIINEKKCNDIIWMIN